MRTILVVAAIVTAWPLATLTTTEPQSIATVAQRDDWRGDLDAPAAVVSADGRYIAFTSYLGLVPADVNDRRDVYVLDCDDGRITLESLTAEGRVSSFESTHPGISADGATIVYETMMGADASPGIVLRDRRSATVQVIGVANGPTGSGWSRFPAISADGQAVAFSSTAPHLAEAMDRSAGSHVYIYDRRGGSIRRVSVELDRESDALPPRTNVAPSISADGRFVAFTAAARRGGTQPRPSHVYLRDTHLDLTRRVSGDGAGSPPDLPSWDPAISGDGRYVVFVSEAPNLAPNDRNRSQDVFLYDVQARSTELVSRSARGGSGNGRSGNPAISVNGRFVVFQSEASDLVCAGDCAAADADINLLWDVFLFDRQTRAVKRLSADAREGWMEASGGPSVDASGRVVTFSSRHPVDSSDTRNDFDLFVWTDVPPGTAAGNQERCAAARLASARTASTIDISPIPLPIEMFWRKIRSTMDGSTRAMSSGRRPESVRSRMDARALAETPDGFSTAK
jgi:Tol biopolymer transport system component